MGILGVRQTPRTDLRVFRAKASEKTVITICGDAETTRKTHDAVSVFDTRDDLVLLSKKFSTIAAD